LKDEAERDGRSVNNLIVFLLNRHIEEQKQQRTT
jgi:hypothetical protein